MKRRLIIALFIIIVSGIILNRAYNNFVDSNNVLDMVFSSNQLTQDEKNWLKEKEYLVYSSDHDTPPLRYVDENTGRYVGLVVDYMEALSLELGIEIKMQPDIWQNALDNLKVGTVDMVDLYPSEKRSEFYYFSNPIFYQNAILVVKNTDETITDVTSLNGKKVAAQTGDFVNEYLENNAPGAIITNTDDYRQAVELLRDGQVEVVVGDESVIYHFLNLYDMTEEFSIHDELLYENKFVLGVPKSEQELIGILNKAIKAINRSDTLTRIQQKWFGISTPISNPNISTRWVVPILFTMIVIIVIAYLINSWNNALKREVEFALEDAEIALQTTFDGLTHLMIVLNELHIIINANKTFQDLFDEKVIGQPISNLLDVDLSKSMQEISWKGKLYEVSIHLTDSSNQSKIVMLKDITSLKINERQLLSANKMAAIGQLAAGVAHEIRNPLGLIRNHTYVLKTNNDEGIRDKSFKMIEKSVERASNIIDNLLNFSSLSGSQETEIHLKRFLKNIVELHEKTLSKSHIHVNIECDEDVRVQMNLESLKHVFLNLISNAIDAIESNGEIDIHCQVEQSKLIVEVVDTGCGVNEQTLSEMFNPFYTTKSPGEGTGLGLYIVYSEVEKLGGLIDVQSKLGKGTMFTLTFPMKESK
jgi:polar amino acid transport system substrate-binding protein